MTSLIDEGSILEHQVRLFYDMSDRSRGPTVQARLQIPGTQLLIVVWSEFNFSSCCTTVDRSSKITEPATLFTFSVYDNGAIVNPETDARFKEAYENRFTKSCRKPWVECYFSSLKEIRAFLYECSFVSNHSIA